MFKKIIILLPVIFSPLIKMYAQPCSTFSGMTPSSAIPVCGTSVFHQALVTDCTGPNVAHTGCAESVTSNKSFWYKFTCYQTGTLGFLISGISNTDDYDWILMDITGRDPNDVFTDASLQVSLNIYGTSGGAGAPFPNSPTGCTPAGSGDVHCAGDAATNSPFNRMPTIIAGHEYLLMVTNWTSGSVQGYDLSFTGGTASITDPKEPHLQAAKAPCDGTLITIKLNKKIKCSSLSTNGSEFTITPSVANVIAAEGIGCTNGFDMDSVNLTLDAPVPPGNYTISIKNGTDGNTLLDNCDRQIHENENIPVTVYPLFPTPMDSLSDFGCAPDLLQLVFSKDMLCNSIAPDGSDFIITGPAPVTIASAYGSCTSGLTKTVTIKLDDPIQAGGTYTITLMRSMLDGNTLLNDCGQETPVGSTLTFTAADTVNANFTYNIRYGCKRDTVDYFHDGKNGVNFWKWNFDDLTTSALQNPTIIYNTFGEKRTQLIVSNGVCSDTSVWMPILLDNELKVDFEATAVVCPGEFATFTDKSTGKELSWLWDFGNGNTSTSQQPDPQTYPPAATTKDIIVKLFVTDKYGCTDFALQKITVPNNCYIAVPNAFTPNNDGLNDYLYPLNAYKATDIIFKIYNRFGQLMFETNDWNKRWNGTYKGQKADTGTYIWMLEYTHTDTQKRVKQKGSTILLR